MDHSDGPSVEDHVASLVRRLTSESDGKTEPRGTETIEVLRGLLSSFQGASAAGYEAKEAFRVHNGFEAIFSSQKALANAWRAFDELQQQESVDCLQLHLRVISTALDGHSRNLEYFSNRTDGWFSLHPGLEIIYLNALDHATPPRSTVDGVAPRILGVLLAIALQKESLDGFFCVVHRDTPPVDANMVPLFDKSIFQDLLETDSNLRAPIIHPSLLSIMLKLCMKSCNVLAGRDPGSTANNAQDSSRTFTLRLFHEAYALMLYLVSLSDLNCLTLHEAGVLTVVLRFVLVDLPSGMQLDDLVDLPLKLLQYGLSSLEDAECLASPSREAQNTSELFLDIVRLSRDPPTFLFDLTRTGYASLELPELGSPFPPLESARGYSIMMWLRIEKYDDACHTTLFGAFDSSQTCFVLLYLERKHRQLVLQTSLSSKDPSVRFKSVNFQENRFYHLTIVHQRSRTAGPARALLYVDGTFREQVRCAFPSFPPRTMSAMPKLSRNTVQYSPVQAFFGTPHDLSPKLGAGLLKSKWSLATGYLFRETLPSDLILVYQKLGPSYRGNFQDCLGSFQTYDASATLNLYSESSPQDGRNQSIISAAIHSQGSKICPESNILLSLSPSFSSSPYSRKSGVRKSLSLIQANETRISARIPNTAIPSLLKGPSRKNGVASIMGGTVLRCPLTAQEAIWRLSGCVPTALKRVALASTATSLLSAVDFFFDSFMDNWRNSEAMERRNGYGLLALLLQTKLCDITDETQESKLGIAPLPSEMRSNGELCLAVLNVILRSTTLAFDKESSALIINPLAYRMLLIDSDLWHRSGAIVQRFFFEQIIVFTSKSNHSKFNIRRLLRMRIIKRFIEIMKSGNVHKESCTEMMAALTRLLESSTDAETSRAVALYITYAIHNPSDQISTKDQKVSSRPRTPPLGLSSLEIGIVVLNTFTDLICDRLGRDAIFRFSRSVTTKWLLYLVDVDNARVVGPSFRLLAHMLITGGENFRAKFESRQGFLLLRLSISRWFMLEDVWLMSFALLFGLEPVKTESRGLQDLGPWLLRAAAAAKFKNDCLPAWDILKDLLKNALRAACAHDKVDGTRQGQGAADETLLLFVVSLISALYSQIPLFRQNLESDDFIRSFLSVLYFSITSDAQSGLTENPEDRSKWPKSRDESPSGSNSSGYYSDKASKVSKKESLHKVISNLSLRPATTNSQTSSLRSGGNLIFPLTPSSFFDGSHEAGNICFMDVVRLLVTICTDQILDPSRDFSGLGLFLKAPPSSDAKKSWLNSLVFCKVLSTLEERTESDMSPFQSPRIITNLVRLIGVGVDAIAEGWFIDNSNHLLSFATTFLDRVQQRNIRGLKSVRLCAPLVATAQTSLMNLSIICLISFQTQIMGSAKLDTTDASSSTDHISRNNTAELLKSFLQSFQRSMRCVQTSDITEDNSDSMALPDPRLLPSLTYLLFWHIRHNTEEVRSLALDSFRALLANNMVNVMASLESLSNLEGSKLVQRLLTAVTSQTDEAALLFIDENASNLDGIMSGSPETALHSLIRSINNDATHKARTRSEKRRERLHAGHLRELADRHARTEHELSLRIWNDNIVSSESLKTLRTNQDRQENRIFLLSQYELMRKQQMLLRGASDTTHQPKWSLDEVEGRNRMRIRLSPSHDAADLDYKPKRSTRSNTVTAKSLDSQQTPTNRALPSTVATQNQRASELSEPNLTVDGGSSTDPALLPEDDFEIIADPNDNGQDTEDKNRKVMRSLQRGEQVINVYNVSRIRGLEAVESLLIVGRKALYIVDNLFQRSDGEVVWTSQAPAEERDSFVQLIAGREVRREGPSSSGTTSTTRHWPWAGIVSISKRTFLLRPVAVELFFEDGRSYLLVAITEGQRDSLYSSLFDRSLRLQEPILKPGDPGAWRIDLLPNPKDAPATVAGRFASAFSLSSSIPATQKWIKGEMSNFQYLMIVNTMAGRTFNDLTQYPVFPWVLADYTSEDIDLTNPRSFRDLSKPMGCQNPQREAAFRDRFETFADMNESSTPAFHYGTHYSSAMIVTSYLIRLQPYVDAYLLLQGGSFDHADRLFHSIERTWSSASQTNMSDVRELTPEFFYLPEFLNNSNGYDFGLKEGDGQRINNVQLPPWAKGDPRIFILKHQQALESPYVSQTLHLWIDLIFGFKQRGESAKEATNVFHHLSYQGSRDIDNIDDPMERLATIGIIHNFGQTPRQVFSRAHPQRTVITQKARRLHKAIDALIRLPSPTYEYMHPIMELEFIQAQQRLLFCGPGRSYLSGINAVLEWANADGSVRFFAMEGGQLMGLFEGLHQRDITAARFANSTLVTTSKDCTVGLWSLNTTPGAVDLHLDDFLFGHRHPVHIVITSEILSIILTGDASGRLMLWDFNTHELIREFKADESLHAATINHGNGHILLACGQKILLYSINGDLIVEQCVTLIKDDFVSCCAFYESSGTDWIDTELVFTGHRHGVANVWKVIFDSKGKWYLENIRRLDHIDKTRADGLNYPSTITALCPTDLCIYTGDEDGRVVSFSEFFAIGIVQY